MSSISKLIAEKRIIVCCGSGGVGKTTTSAALAMRAAQEGKRAVVITIDPAKRLATSLGLKALGSKATDLTDHVNEALKAENIKPITGRFFAVMPDTNETFESWVRSMAGDNQGLAARVLKTSIYKIFAKEFSGTNEYMAMEKLYELYEEHQYDLVVLDTPPSANTRSFLEAPRLLAGFFDDKMIKWFISPGSRILATGLKKVMEILEKLTGHGFISDLIEFTTALFALRTQFMENLCQVGDLLHQKDAAFIMVTSPERLSKNDTQGFVELIHEQAYPFWGFVVNRVLGRKLKLAPGQTTPDNTLTTDKIELEVLSKNFTLLTSTLEHEKDAFDFLRGLSAAQSKYNVALVPEQRSDVHSVSALLELSRQLGE